MVPIINELSREIVNATPFYERLYEDPEKKKNKLKSLQKKVMQEEGCTFRPATLKANRSANGLSQEKRPSQNTSAPPDNPSFEQHAPRPTTTQHEHQGFYYQFPQEQPGAAIAFYHIEQTSRELIPAQQQPPLQQPQPLFRANASDREELSTINERNPSSATDRKNNHFENLRHILYDNE